MSSIPLHSPGHVYLMSNASMPGLIKIGASTDSPHIRAKQLTASTSSPTPFVVLYYRKMRDCTDVESAMHRAFADRRVNDSREFFEVSLFEAARTLDALSGAVYTDLKLDPPTPFAKLFNSFPDDGRGRELTEDEREKCRRLEQRTYALGEIAMTD